ncbi:O-antigen ligase [Halomonas sp. SL1]|uniref:O-antigen ligase family protein n=1 Tax=Halomonas sp. SL1 TaxID=2137478 RepID=UPI000D170CAF|nr:O-antigen ligase family protein [Halomonas sp. SL1]RAH38198.1 O-antigen ligase domain-containing protein [Halomonas sp. SL1]
MTRTPAAAFLPLAVILFCLAAGVFLPWQLWSLPPYDLQRAFQGGALAWLVAVGGFQARRPLYCSLAAAAFAQRLVSATVALLMLLAAALSPFPGIGLLELSYLLALGVSVAVLAIHAARLTTLCWMLTGGLLALFMLAYGVFAIDHVRVAWAVADRHDFGPGFANVRFFADVAVGVMPLSLLYVVSRQAPSRVAAMLCLAPLTVWWWLLWVSESRGALLGLVVAGPCALWLLGRGARWPVGLLAISGVMGLLGWWYLNPLGGAGDSAIFVRDITSGSGRLALWRDALAYSVEHFPLGLGPMGFAADGHLRSAHVHNLLLNTAAEWGLPLALLWLALMLLGCRALIRKARDMPESSKPVFACLVMAFVGMMVNVQVAGAQVVPLSALVMVLVTGLVFGYRPGSGASSAPRAKAPVPIGATLAWAASVLMIIYLLIAGLALYRLAVDSTPECFRELGRAYLYPRFWSQGRQECMQLVAPEHWLFRQ